MGKIRSILLVFFVVISAIYHSSANGITEANQSVAGDYKHGIKVMTECPREVRNVAKKRFTVTNCIRQCKSICYHNNFSMYRCESMTVCLCDIPRYVDEIRSLSESPEFLAGEAETWWLSGGGGLRSYS
ncbi:hypothetical protein ACP275_10G152300 [Erythranthe tilingii]